MRVTTVRGEYEAPSASASASASGGDASLQALLRPELRELRAYVPHDPPGIDVRLDANEASAELPEVRAVVARAIGQLALERYPDPRALRLKEAIARRTGARPTDLLVGSGSDEIIALLATALSRPRVAGETASIVVPAPTFVMYRVTARAHGLAVIEVPLDAAWDLDLDAMTSAIAKARPNVVFVASPNNPTGNRMSEERLEALLEATRGQALVVVDEAYIDYAHPGASLRAWRSRFRHLAIARTLSKVGLAALRVGWLEADESLVAEIDKVRQPFNLSATSQAAAAAVLEDAWEPVCVQATETIRERARMIRELEQIDGVRPNPSAANFVWVWTRRLSAEVSEGLCAKGILVRSFHRTTPSLDHYLRVTVGTEAENSRFLEALHGLAGAS